MSKTRETIKISDITTDKYINVVELPGFMVVEEEQVGFDTEKGFADFRCILQRESDDKFFEVKYTNYGCGEDDLKESILEEVFPREKTITVYE